MPKMKSSKTLMKRIKITGTGKIKRKHAYMDHQAPNKSRKQRQHLAKFTYVDSTDMPRIHDMIDWKNK
jgi:large subunit ribosomal protein L35